MGGVSLRKLVLCMVIVLLSLLPVSASSVGMNPPVRHVTMTVNATFNPWAQVNIFVNGINLNQKINNLQNKYNKLYAQLQRQSMSIGDYMFLSSLRDELVELYNSEIVQAIQTNNTTLARKAFNKESGLLNSMDEAVIQLVSDVSHPTPKYPSMGWFDVYGNHWNFNESDYLVQKGLEFRIDNCYSSIGQSTVLKGDKIYIVGEISTYGKDYHYPLRVTLVDPESGHNPETVIWSAIGYNNSNPYTGCSITWVYPREFKIAISTSSMYPGIKRIDIGFGGYNVSCMFRVVKPYLHVTHVAGFTKVCTNYPYVKVGKEVMKPVGGVLYLNGNVSVVGVFSP